MRNLDDATDSFAVLSSGKRLQTAVMDLAPGEASGPKANEHAESEQVLYVVSGEVVAEIAEQRCTMRAGDSVIVPAGAPHRFANHGSAPARTFNVYSPPAY